MTTLSPIAARAVAPPLHAAAKQLEAVFLRQMLSAMRATAGDDPLMGSDAANEFRDMSDARLAEAMAGRFGIAAMVERQLGGSAPK
jgi:flagellar protein FlgJ